MKLLGGVLIMLALVSGCGDLGATDEELNQAYHRGEKTGLTKGRAGQENIYRRINEASEESYEEGRRRGWSNGWDEGWDEGWEALEETIAEETSYEFDSTPEKIDGSESYEFEPEDLERAEEAPADVREYCEGAVSEAQELGCLSHVESWEVP